MSTEAFLVASDAEDPPSLKDQPLKASLHDPQESSGSLAMGGCPPTKPSSKNETMRSVPRLTFACKRLMPRDNGELMGYIRFPPECDRDHRRAAPWGMPAFDTTIAGLRLVSTKASEEVSPSHIWTK
jgi:hypothetical protein